MLIFQILFSIYNYKHSLLNFIRAKTKMRKRVYPQNQNSNKAMHDQSQTQIKLSQQKMASFTAGILATKCILKNKLHQRYSKAFQTLRGYTIQKHKAGIYLANKLAFLYKKKYVQKRSEFWNVLVNLKIQSHLKNSQRIQKLKGYQKSKAVQILIPLTQKMIKNRLKGTFSELKFRTLLISKLRIYKVLHLSNIFGRLKGLTIKNIFGKLRLNSFQVTLKGKSFYHLQKFMSEKPKTLLIEAFEILKKTEKKTSLKENEKNISQNQQKNSSNNVLAELAVSEQQRQLQQKKTQLQTQLKEIQKANRISKEKLQKEVQKLQSEFQGLKFNNQFLQQDNKELQKAVQLRQTRDKKKLSQNQVWQSVYYSLLAYLYSKSTGCASTVKKEELISAMEVPLAKCGIKLDQIIQQNKILQQLLTAYKQNFPQPQNNPQMQIVHLPYQILKKQNKYYFQSIEILSGWGTNDAMQVNQLKNELSLLRKQFQ